MPPTYRTSIFLFHRDLRLDDNRGLLFALEHSRIVLPIFILDPRQIQSHPYQSKKGLFFLKNALLDLDEQLKNKKARLAIFFGSPSAVLMQILKKVQVDALLENRDYTPFARRRTLQLEKLCKTRSIAFHSLDDLLLHEPEAILQANSQPYRIFTHFFRNALPRAVPIPQKCSRPHFLKFQFDNQIQLDQRNDWFPNEHLFISPKRSDALRQLDSVPTSESYSRSRDDPLRKTIHLSAYLKFGLISIREAHRAIRQKDAAHPMLRSLFWRDFFSHIAYRFPRVFGHSFQAPFDRLPWSDDPDNWNAWCNGQTGFPIVDAGMRELVQTGFMHNRLRMITASFLVKDLLQDWRRGEQFFAQHLLDYDPAVNNGNWQWCASTGCDAQPFFRIFNPWRQQKKFDPDGTYIRRWIPELQNLSPQEIHDLEIQRPQKPVAYPRPIVDHAIQAKKAIAFFRENRA